MLSSAPPRSSLAWSFGRTIRALPKCPDSPVATRSFRLNSERKLSDDETHEVARGPARGFHPTARAIQDGRERNRGGARLQPLAPRSDRPTRPLAVPADSLQTRPPAAAAARV